MKFNINDLRNGNIGEAYFREIISTVKNKLDPLKHNQSDVDRIVSNLKASVEDILIFINKVKVSLDEVNKNIQERKDIWNIKVLSQLVKINLSMLELDVAISHMQSQEAYRLHVEHLDRINIAKRDKLNQDAEQANLNILEQERLNMLLEERARLEDRLKELTSQKNALNNKLNELNSLVKASRADSIKETVKHIDKVQVNGVDTFEDMNEENKRDFVEGYFAIDELAQKKKARLNININDNEKKLEQLLADTNKGSTTMLFDSSNAKRNDGAIRVLRNAIAKDKSERLKIDVDRDNAIRKLGDRVGHNHINNSVPIEEFQAHLDAFEYQGDIKLAIEKHRENVNLIEPDLLYVEKELEDIEEEWLLTLNNSSVNLQNNLEEHDVKFDISEIKPLDPLLEDISDELLLSLEQEFDSFELGDLDSLAILNSNIELDDIDNIDNLELQGQEANKNGSSLKGNR